MTSNPIANTIVLLILISSEERVHLLSNVSPPVSFVVISHPQAIKEIFTAPVGHFDSGKANQAFRPLLGNNSLLLLDGIQHQQQRRLLSPFHGEHLSKYSQIICSITQQEIQQWILDRPLVIRPQVQAITLRIILQIIFGSQQEQSVESLNQCLSSLVDSFISPFWWKRFSFPQKKQQLDELVYAQIHQRQQQTVQLTTDIISLLLSARDEAGAALTDEEIRIGVNHADRGRLRDNDYSSFVGFVLGSETAGNTRKAGSGVV